MLFRSQALEVGIDPAHASFLHRFLADEDPAEAYGKQFRDYSVGTQIPMTRLLREYFRPEIVVDETPYGMRITALRHLDDETTHVRVTNQVFPHGIVIPMSETMNITQWHVPVDDTHSYWYAMFTSYAEPVDHAQMREQRLALYQLPDYRPRVGRHNRYGFDAEDQRRNTYTGMGPDINVHDQWAVESPGPIFDRTQEHLGHSDVAIRAFRARLIASIDGRDRNRPPFLSGDLGEHALAGPAAIDTVAPRASWEYEWRQRAEARRNASDWVGASQTVSGEARA